MYFDGARQAFVEHLAEYLTPFYLPPRTPEEVSSYCNAAHGPVHITGMLALGPRIQGIGGLNGPLCFDPYEFEAAVWLHNADRADGLKKELHLQTLQAVVYVLLEESPFDPETRSRIADAVLQHSKKDDEPGDSDLLSALRIADKINRFSATGVWSAASHCWYLEPYNRKNPFGYGGTAEENLRSQYSALFRGLEWVKMLPSDEARDLIDRRGLRLFIEFIRCLGEEIARDLGVENRSEEDIRKALGPYYKQFGHL